MFNVTAWWHIPAIIIALVIFAGILAIVFDVRFVTKWLKRKRP